MVDVVSREEWQSEAKAIRKATLATEDRLERVQDGLGETISRLMERVDALEQEPQPVQTVPRVITAEELKVGQVVAFSEDVFWDHGKVVLRDGEVRFKYWTSGPDALHRDPYFCDTIVLLQEAPTP